MLGLTCSFKLDWGSYLISIVKTATKKIETFIISIKILPPEVPLCLYNSTIWHTAMHGILLSRLGWCL